MTHHIPAHARCCVEPVGFARLYQVSDVCSGWLPCCSEGDYLEEGMQKAFEAFLHAWVPGP